MIGFLSEVNSSTLYLSDLSHVFLGTTKIKNLDSNIGSLRVELKAVDLEDISDAIPINEVAGDRITENFIRCSWKFADTPAKDSNIA